MEKDFIKRLQEIRSEMCDLVEEAEQIVRCHGDRHSYERAKAYWVGHMNEALGGDFNHYVGKSMCSFADTIRENGGMVDDDECEECGGLADQCDCEFCDDCGLVDAKCKCDEAEEGEAVA